MSDLGPKRVNELIDSYLRFLNAERSRLLSKRRLWGWFFSSEDQERLVYLDQERNKLHEDWLRVNDIPTPAERVEQVSTIVKEAQRLITEIDRKLREQKENEDPS